MPLSKEEREQLAALQAKENEPPDRRESINVDFVYDPDDAESVKKGLKRGHLTKDDVVGWGWDPAKLGIKEESGEEEEEDEEDKPRERGPRRRGGYFDDK